MIQYNKLLLDIARKGQPRPDRTGTGTTSLFSPEDMHFDLEEGFPIQTTKKVHFKSVVAELLWFLLGSTNIAYLVRNGVKIWNEWADEGGELGPIYGKQWRKWATQHGSRIDQIKQLIEGLKSDPFSRRHIVSAWNVADLSKMALQPCHVLFQCYVDNSNGLHLKLYQRSADAFLGVPFNIASYALLCHLLARAAGLTARRLIISLGDAHIYNNHFEQVQTVLNRPPRPLPTLQFNTENIDIDQYKIEDFELVGYDPHPAVKAPISV